MGPMLSTRPASRPLSDLMDLNLSLKFDKTGKQAETRQPRKKRSQELSARSGSRDDGRTAGEKADLTIEHLRSSRTFSLVSMRGRDPGVLVLHTGIPFLCVNRCDCFKI